MERHHKHKGLTPDGLEIMEKHEDDVQVQKDIDTSIQTQILRATRGEINPYAKFQYDLTPESSIEDIKNFHQNATAELTPADKVDAIYMLNESEIWIQNQQQKINDLKTKQQQLTQQLNSIAETTETASPSTPPTE